MTSLGEDWVKWITPKERAQMARPYLITMNGMMFLQRGRVVVTDRLHGHVLCVLCGIPHVVIDPVNNKTSSYMRSWTGGLENILVPPMVHSLKPLNCCENLIT